MNKTKRIVMIKNNGEVKIFKNQVMVAKQIGKTQGSVNHYLRGRATSKDFKLMYEDEYNKRQNEIQKPTTEDIYINIFVGLANGTLVDGAKYKIGTNEYVYDKEKQALLVNGYTIYTKEKMFEKVEVQLPLLTEKERDFLKNLLKAFNNVKGIRKCNAINKGMEFIRIETSTPANNIDLPDFKEGQYYGNLKSNELYSIDELNLQED